MIGDLGHAKMLDNNASNTNNRSYGTNSYLAPEAYHPSKRSVKLDIWYSDLLFNFEMFINFKFI